MKTELATLLNNLYLACVSKTGPGTPAPVPVAPEVEQSLDEWLRQLAQGRELRPLSAQEAAALMPRLFFAREGGAPVQALFEDLSTSENEAAMEAAMLEFLLIESWHTKGKKRWLSCGK